MILSLSFELWLTDVPFGAKFGKFWKKVIRHSTLLKISFTLNKRAFRCIRKTHNKVCSRINSTDAEIDCQNTLDHILESNLDNQPQKRTISWIHSEKSEILGKFFTKKYFRALNFLQFTGRSGSSNRRVLFKIQPLFNLQFESLFTWIRMHCFFRLTFKQNPLSPNDQGWFVSDLVSYEF